MNLSRMYPSKRAIAKGAPVGSWQVWIGAPRAKLYHAHTIHVFQVVEQDGRRVPGAVVYESLFSSRISADLNSARDIAAYLNGVHASGQVARAYVEEWHRQQDIKNAEAVARLLRGE